MDFFDRVLERQAVPRNAVELCQHWGSQICFVLHIHQCTTNKRITACSVAVEHFGFAGDLEYAWNGRRSHSVNPYCALCVRFYIGLELWRHATLSRGHLC